MHWCFDCTNKCHSNYFTYMPPIGHMDWVGLGHRVDGLDWIGFRKLDPRPTPARLHCGFFQVFIATFQGVILPSA